MQRIHDHLWPDAGGGAADKAFAIALHRLREQVGRDALSLRDRRLRLNPRKCWVDAWTFESLAARTREGATASPGPASASLAQALDLYRGEFLAGEPEAPWVVIARESLGNLFLRAVLQRCDELAGAANLPSVVTQLERGLEQAPTAEALYQRLMGCQQRLGRHADLEATYRRCRRLLDAHLGVAPSEDTERLYCHLTGRA